MPAHRKAASGPSSAARPAGRAPSPLDRWPFRRKLNVLVIVPLAVISAMIAHVVLGEIGNARSAADTARLVRDSAQVTRLIDAVQTEHRQALLVSLRHEAGAAGDSAPDTTAYLDAQQEVGARIDAVRGAYGDRLPDAEAQALKELEGLDSLRTTVEQGPIPADNIDPAYGSVIEGLIGGLGLGAAGGESASSSANLLDALLRADTAHASFETSVFAARTRNSNALIEFTGAVGDIDQYTYQAERFTRFAGQDQGTALAGIERSPYQSVIGQHWAALQVDPGALVADTSAQVRAALDDALRADPTYERQAANRLKIVQSLIDGIAADARTASHDAWWRVGWLVAANLLAFAAWMLLSVLTRRSVLRTVRSLTAAAQHVAGAAGTELARVADDDADDTGPPRLEAVPVPVRDEIGELAEAFNQVQVTATALLERQVVSRRNIAEMFGNVGRRVSNLTARQLALIDSVERGETDPEVLDRLYRIDHIAVRLQRNADSLMLLAGISETGVTTEPMRLSNVVRAALGQIEGYQRVTPHAEGDVTVVPDIVGDLTLMLAELLENAVMFSPATSGVEVVAAAPARRRRRARRDHRPRPRHEPRAAGAGERPADPPRAARPRPDRGPRPVRGRRSLPALGHRGRADPHPGRRRHRHRRGPRLPPGGRRPGPGRPARTARHTAAPPRRSGRTRPRARRAAPGPRGPAPQACPPGRGPTRPPARPTGRTPAPSRP